VKELGSGFLEAVKAALRVNPKELSRYFEARVVTEGVVKPPIAIRLDGVGFKKALKGFRKPRDVRVHNALVKGAEALMKRFEALATYVVSDEVNAVIASPLPYGGRVFKLVSTSASILSSHVSVELGMPLYFDSRVVKLGNLSEAAAYLMYRARVGVSNYISSTYHAVTGGGGSTPKAGYMLNYLAGLGLFKGVREWEVLGSCLTWSYVVKEGFNPLTGEGVKVLRRVVKVSPSYGECVRYLTRRLSYGGVGGRIGEAEA